MSDAGARILPGETCGLTAEAARVVIEMDLAEPADAP